MNYKAIEKTLKIDMLSDIGIEEEFISSLIHHTKPENMLIGIEHRGIIAFQEEEHFYNELYGKKMPDLRHFVEDYRKKEFSENPLIIFVNYPFTYSPDCEYTRVGPMEDKEYKFTIFRDDENRAILFGGSASNEIPKNINGFILSKYLENLFKNDPKTLSNNFMPMFIEYRKRGYIENTTPHFINEYDIGIETIEDALIYNDTKEFEKKIGGIPGVNAPGKDTESEMF